MSSHLFKFQAPFPNLKPRVCTRARMIDVPACLSLRPRSCLGRLGHKKSPTLLTLLRCENRQRLLGDGRAAASRGGSIDSVCRYAELAHWSSSAGHPSHPAFCGTDPFEYNKIEARDKRGKDQDASGDVRCWCGTGTDGRCRAVYQHENG